MVFFPDVLTLLDMSVSFYLLPSRHDLILVIISCPDTIPDPRNRHTLSAKNLTNK